MKSKIESLVEHKELKQNGYSIHCNRSHLKGVNSMNVSKKRGFFGVIIDPQSYLNIVYLLVAFPLGIFYFVFLITGLSLGFGLLITLVGIPILLLVLGGSWAFCKLERNVAITMLKEEIPAASSQPIYQGLWSRVKVLLKDSVTWTGMLYLLLKFPLGIVSFTIAVTLISVSLSLLTAPIYYSYMNLGFWNIDMLWEAFVLTLIGIPMVFISLHLMNGAAFLSGRLARVMLGKLQ